MVVGQLDEPIPFGQIDDAIYSMQVVAASQQPKKVMQPRNQNRYNVIAMAAIKNDLSSFAKQPDIKNYLSSFA